MYQNRYRIPNQLQPPRLPGIDLRCLPSAIRAQNELLCPSNPNLSNLRINVFSSVVESINGRYFRITLFWETDPRTCFRNFTDRDIVDIYDEGRGYSYEFPLINTYQQRARTHSYMNLETNRRFYKTVIKGSNNDFIENFMNQQSADLHLRINGVKSNSVQVNVVNKQISYEALQLILQSDDDILDRYLTGY